MSSFLWLLLYLAPLLGLTAALFAWFGWRWRGADLLQRIDELTQQRDAALQAKPEPKEEEPKQTVEAPAVVESAVVESAVTAAALLEMESRHEEMVKELNALRARLQAAENDAQAAAKARQEEAVKAHEAMLALETETARLLNDLDRLRAEHAASLAELASLRSAPPAVDAVAGESSAPAKPKRKRSTTVKAKPSAAATVSLREITTTLEGQLAAQESSLTALTQERDDWQRRISQLEEKVPPDTAGLGLARRSFADSEKRLAAAKAQVERLQNQTRVLLRVEAQAAALSDVPDDDLTQIKGIKKVISEQLRAHGIRTWRQIAQWDNDEQRAFSELLAFKNRSTREQWQEQARALHDAAHGPSA